MDLDEAVPKACVPSQSEMNKILEEEAAKKFILTRNELSDEEVKLYLSADKGHKKGIGHFVKYLSFFSKVNDRVKKQLLDVDASGGTSEDCANAIDFSVKKVDPPGEEKKLDGQMTDAGGGGQVKVFKMH